RMVGAESAAAILTHADELPSRRTETVPEHARVRALPTGTPNPAGLHADARLRDVVRPRREPPQLSPNVSTGANDRIPHEHRRTARGRRGVEWHDRGVSHGQDDAIGAHAQFPPRDLCEDGPRA